MAGALVLILLAAAQAPAREHDCAATLSSQNRTLLTRPGYFAVHLVRGHWRGGDAPQALPFPLEDLRPGLLKGLRDAGVPVASDAQQPTARPLSLVVSFAQSKDGDAYFVQLELDLLPDDPKDPIYDDIWPQDFGAAETPRLRVQLSAIVQGLTRQFGCLFRLARSAAP